MGAASNGYPRGVDPADLILNHYGVKGMRWGKRKRRGPASPESVRATAIKNRAKTSSIKSLSNAELQEAINRMNLEQQYKRLHTAEKPPVAKFVSKVLTEFGQQQAKSLLLAKLR